MKLTIMDRLLLLNLDTLPKQGTLLTMRILQDATKKIGFTEEELKSWNIHQEGPHVKWKPDLNQEVDIPLGEKAIEMIRTALETTEAITVNHFSLADKFGAGQEKPEAKKE